MLLTDSIRAGSPNGVVSAKSGVRIFDINANITYAQLSNPSGTTWVIKSKTDTLESFLISILPPDVDLPPKWGEIIGNILDQTDLITYINNLIATLTGDGTFLIDDGNVVGNTIDIFDDGDA